MLALTDPTSSGAPASQRRLERLDFDRIAERGTGAVRLDEADLVWLAARIGERVADHRFLRRAVRCGQTIAAPVLVRGRTAQHGDDAIAIGLRPREPLEDEDATAFAAHEAVGARVERLAAAVGGHHVRLRERDRDVGPEDQVHAAGEREIAFAATQAVHRLVDRDQRRRARRVDRDARAAQPKRVRQPPGRDAVRRARRGVRVEAGDAARAAQQLVVVAGRHAEVDGAAAAFEPLRRDAGVLERAPRHFEQQPLLRVHAVGLARRDAEEVRVETVDRAEEAAPARGHLARRVRIGVEVVVDRPALVRHLADRVDAVAQQLPVFLRGVGATGKAATDADDGDGLVARLLEALHAVVQLVRKQREALGGELTDAGEEIRHL